MAQTVKNWPAPWDTQVQFLGWEDPLENGMTTHSSKSGGLQSMGSPRVRHDWVTNMQSITLQGRRGINSHPTPMFDPHKITQNMCSRVYTGNQYSLKYTKKARGKTKAPQRALLTCEKGNFAHPRAKSSHEYSLPHEESLLSVGISTVEHLKYTKWHRDFCLNPKRICLHKKCVSLIHRVFFLTKHTFSPPKSPKLSSCESQIIKTFHTAFSLWLDIQVSLKPVWK